MRFELIILFRTKTSIMKGTILLLLLAASLLFSNVGYAAFPIKTAASKTEILTTAATGNADNAAVTAKHHSFFSRLIHFLMKPKAVISQPLYIVLAVFWLGWLAMGINENFADWDWVLSLVLYILFWLPGFIYTLIMMHKYY